MVCTDEKAAPLRCFFVSERHILFYLIIITYLFCNACFHFSIENALSFRTKVGKVPFYQAFLS